MIRARTLPTALTLTLLSLTGCDKTTPGVAPAGVDDPHVLILVVDGVRVEEFTSAFASDLTGERGEDYASAIWDALGEEAMVVRGAFNLALPSTAPAHATIVTGTHQPVMTTPLHVEDPGVYRPLLPTIFEEARAQKGWGEGEARLLANAVIMPNSTFSIAPGYGAGAVWEQVTDPGGNTAQEDDEVISRLKALIDGGPPRVMLANLHNADRVAHTGDERGYLDKVREQARDIAGFYRWLEDDHPDYLWQLQLVVVADHGRHRHDLEGGWSGHGDSCDGCREVPMFVLGGGIEPGVVGGTFALQDLAPTLAAHLGIDLPWADGLPFGPGADKARRGLAYLSGSGGLEAATRYRQDLEARSEVVVWSDGGDGGSGDPEVLSTPGATLAEAPVALRIAQGEAAGDLVCFRELVLDPEEDWWPWTPRCLHRAPGGSWRDIGFPEENVGPFWRPGLAVQGDTVRAFWLHTPLSRDIADDTDRIRWAAWSPDTGWSAPGEENIDFISTETAAAATDRGFVTAVTTNDNPNNAYTRRIEIRAFTGDTYDTIARFNLHGVLTGDRRTEQPALRAEGDAVQLAMIGVDESQRGVAYARSEDGGLTWGGEGWIPRDGLYVHLAPAWDGEWLVWAEQPGDPRTDEAQICRARSDAESPACLPVGSPRVQSFTAEGGTVRAVVDQGTADWEIATLSF